MSDRIRLATVLATLENEGVAVTFDVYGSTGIIEDCLAAYWATARERGTDRWVGAHVGSRDADGAYWDHRGRLRYRHDDSPVATIWWSFNTAHPELAALLVRRLVDRGFTASWSGGPGQCVELQLDAPR